MFILLFSLGLLQIIGCSDDISEKTKEVLCQISCEYKSLHHTKCPCKKIDIKDWTFPMVMSTNSPSILCKTANMIVFRWTEPLTEFFSYIAEMRTMETSWEIYSKGFGNDPTFVIDDLKNTSYKHRMWIISSGGNIFSTISSVWINMTTNVELLQVPEVKLKKMLYETNSCTAVIQWTPSSDLACFYSLVVQIDDDYEEHYIDDHSKLFEEAIEDLAYDTTYIVGISAIDGDRGSETMFINFTTPMCINIHANLSVCPPNAPENITVEATDINQSYDFIYVDFKVSWSETKLIPDLYSIQFSSFDVASVISKKSVNISGENMFVYLKGMKLRKYFQISVRALAMMGWSKKNLYSNKIEVPAYHMYYKFRISIIGIVVILVIFVCLVCLAFMIHKKDKKERKESRNHHFQEMEEERSNFTAAAYNIQGFVGDEWELNPDKILIQSEVGNGAFGIVRHGWLIKDDDRMDVAVKSLKNVPPVAEEIRHFQQELEIMKCVGSHNHVVSLIGCYFKKDFGPLLVVEYCSKGDLQKYLRHAFERNVNNKFNIQHVGLLHSTESGNVGNSFANKMYDTLTDDEENENALLPRDLLSFARQIAMGMEYLSNLKVVHRDLAARNILVCQDKTVKVSDFGLSRDVYKDNVYQKTANGKLPIKWMAIESFTHHRYTTQSDVWSFGILLWEIVSLGAMPYPGIPAECLVSQLKSGYRMERPLNCGKELYDLMFNCWRWAPKDRPTFSKLRECLEKLLETEIEYLCLDIKSCIETNLTPVT